MKRILLHISLLIVFMPALWAQRSGARTVTNPFNPDNPINPGEYVLEVQAFPIAGGTATGGGYFSQGEEAEISAEANTGYHFAGWSDGNLENPRLFIIGSCDTTLTACFAPEGNFWVHVVAEQGAVSGAGYYPVGSKVTIQAMGSDCYEFTQWSDGNTDNPREVTVVSDCVYRAECALKHITIKVESDDPNKGSVDVQIVPSKTFRRP